MDRVGLCHAEVERSEAESKGSVASDESRARRRNRCRQTEPGVRGYADFYLLGVECTVLHVVQNRVMFAAGGFGDLTRLALYSSTAFNAGPITHSYIAPMLYSSRGSDSMLKTLG